MSYALIDNASLTAVQRAMGQVVVKNPDTINGDLVALENIVQAILFYDELVCVDNYKKQHKQAREKEFDFIRFISPTDFGLDQIEEKAKEEARSINPEITAGEFSDPDFKELLELLKVNMVCTWDLRTSVYYLTMKMLGQPNTPEYDKYSELSASIFNELSDIGCTTGHWSTDVKLYRANGNEYTKEEMIEAVATKNRGFGGTTKALDMFIASLNWLAYKSIYYSLIACYFKADTFLHPIRHAYQIHWFKKTGAFGHDFTAKLLNGLTNQLSTSISEIVDHGRVSAISMEIPLFSSWLTVESGDVRNVITSAIELKDTVPIREIRDLLREIRIAFDEGDIVKANKNISKWESDLLKASTKLKSQYGLKTDQGIPSSFLMKAYNTVAIVSGLPMFPEFDFKIPLPDFIKNNTSGNFGTLFKDITHELITTERLGNVRDLMAASFIIDDEYYVAPKTERPEFRHYSSDWKIPM